MSHKQDSDGNPIGLRNANGLVNANLLLDSCQYEVEFLGGSTDVFTVDLSVENLFSQVDTKGRSYSVLSEIVDHCKNSKALSKDDALKMSNPAGRAVASKLLKEPEFAWWV